jgi:hypothetical protein
MAQHGYLREYDEDFGEDRDRGDWRDREERAWRSREHGRGFMFGRDDRDPRAWEDNRDWPQRERGFSSSPDDHYRSWRDRQMQALDRDYADYCREREQAFHRDFDAWRDRRHGTPQPLQPGMTQSGLSADPTGELQLSTEDQSPSQPEQDPTAAATLGTTSGGRRR